MAKRRKSSEIEQEIQRARAVVLEVADNEDATDEDITRSDTALDTIEPLEAELAEAVEYEDRVDALRSRAADDGAVEGGDRGARRDPEVRRNRGPEVLRQVDEFDVLRSSTAHMSETEHVEALRSANLKAIERYEMPDGYTDSFARMIRRHGRDTAWSRNMLQRMTPDYIAAFERVMVGDMFGMTDAQRAAIAVGTNTAGGYLVPTHLDPTLILTNNGVSNVIRGMSRVVTLTGGANRWNGVTTAGATASWDAELTEVSDDTPPIGPASIPVFSAKALIQASIESFEDITGLAADVQMLLADAKDRLEANAHATGNGTTQPTGIFTALDANTNVEMSLTSSTNAFTLADFQRVKNTLGVRWRSRSAWLMNPLFSGRATALNLTLAQQAPDIQNDYNNRLLGRPIVESDEAPSVEQTTTKDNILVFGDFSNFVIVDKPGSTSIEFIPHLFNTSNNLPDGRRAWYMHFRNGSDSVNDLAFRLLQDNTTA